MNHKLSASKVWWLEPAIKLGVPAVIALWLVFWLTQTVMGEHRDMSGELRLHVTQSRTDQEREHADQAVTNELLRAICFTLAQSEFEKATCNR